MNKEPLRVREEFTEEPIHIYCDGGVSEAFFCLFLFIK